jgi:hypothetical protein
MTLTPERQLQIRRAHEALDRCDKEAALAWIGADLDGLCLRVKAAVERQLGLSVPRRDLLPRGPRERRDGSTREAIKIFLRQNPDVSITRAAIATSSGESTVRRAKMELKLEAAEKAREADEASGAITAASRLASRL